MSVMKPSLRDVQYRLHTLPDTDRQTDRYFIDRNKVNPDLFVIKIKERYVHVYTTLLIC